MRRAFLLFVCFLSMSAAARAEDYTFDYSPLCAQAYKAYLALRPDEGDALIKREIIAHPYNLLPVYIADYGDFLTLVFNGDLYQLGQREDHEKVRIERIERGSDDSPWKRLTLAGIHQHWALIHIRFGARLKGALAFRRSYLLLKENASRFPKFAPTAVIYGIEEAMAGTIPDGYKWLMSIFGMKGNLPSGMSRLSGYLKSNLSADSPLHEEAVIFDFYTRFYLGSDKANVWQAAGSDATFDIRNNLLRAFVRANIALSYRKADAAVAAMQIAKATPGANAYPVFDYELGSAMLLRLNPDCTTYLEQFAARNKGKLFTKDALHKAALAWYIKGDMAKATTAKAAILQKGSLITDADITAQRFAKEGRWPQPVIFKARMLIDGGYYPQALTILRNTSATAFPELADKLEYELRLGRALEESGDTAHAVPHYRWVINNGSERGEDFAARAALQVANIYEARKQLAEAKRYFSLCLSMRGHDFQNAIDQQAKAGLARLNRGG